MRALGLESGVGVARPSDAEGLLGLEGPVPIVLLPLRLVLLDGPGELLAELAAGGHLAGLQNFLEQVALLSELGLILLASLFVLLAQPRIDGPT
eukprot:11439625-Alexandrium_andersonii.AAC.1